MLRTHRAGPKDALDGLCGAYGQWEVNGLERELHLVQFEGALDDLKRVLEARHLGLRGLQPQLVQLPILHTLRSNPAQHSQTPSQRLAAVGAGLGLVSENALLPAHKAFASGHRQPAMFRMSQVCG